MYMIYPTEAATILDSLTWTVVVVGILVLVLSVLIVYWIFRSVLNAFRNISLQRSSRKKAKTSPGSLTGEEAMAGEVNAAIAMALYSYFGELHDRESGIVTIKRVSKPYSPWSSKLYNMRNPKIR
ncbi:MAG: hypothetical protein QUS66_03580 [Bacteroidota bacterium]|nr:hypothetical protein [Bacteroidota bacterium]